MRRVPLFFSSLKENRCQANLLSSDVEKIEEILSEIGELFSLAFILLP